MYSTITKRRICGTAELVPVLNLGEQSLTGVFSDEKWPENHLRPVGTRQVLR